MKGRKFRKKLKRWFKERVYAFDLNYKEDIEESIKIIRWVDGTLCSKYKNEDGTQSYIPEESGRNSIFLQINHHLKNIFIYSDSFNLFLECRKISHKSKDYSLNIGYRIKFVKDL